MKKTGYEIWLESPRYQLPHEARALRRDWWTAPQAARAWGVSPRTARRYFAGLDVVTVIAANVKTGRARVLHCVKAGTLRPAVRRGNPYFVQPEWQKANSAKRWDGHITRAEREEWERQYDEAALRDLAEAVTAYLPPDDDEAEEWEPYPMPEPLPIDEQYTEKWLTEAMARKAARMPKERR